MYHVLPGYCFSMPFEWLFKVSTSNYTVKYSWNTDESIVQKDEKWTTSSVAFFIVSRNYFSCSLPRITGNPFLPAPIITTFVFFEFASFSVASIPFHLSNGSLRPLVTMT